MNGRPWASRKAHRLPKAQRRQSRPAEGTVRPLPDGSVVSAICRHCGRRRVMEAVYRTCRRCINRQVLALLDEEFPSEPEPRVRRRIYP